MSKDQATPEGKDPELWEIAKERADFKTHAITYVIINLFLWGIWYFTSDGKPETGEDIGMGLDYSWPIWCTLGWGVGLAFHFASAYVFPKANSVEREYDKLKNQ
jgi:hypothetical protein